MKERSTFFGKESADRIRSNYSGTAHAEKVIRNAEIWRTTDDDTLWKSLFAHTLPRSHMVLSYGWCPSCRHTVGLYDWVHDPIKYPWKMLCPFCSDVYPKNDFGKYYESGLDDHRIFRPEIADKALLYNTEAPDPADPLHFFGVDDGWGYIKDGHRWMFIGTYLKQGLWQQFIYNGILNLSKAYIISGREEYARKCGILFDRLADLFPDFDYYNQGIMYEEEKTSRGYIGYWVDTSVQLRELLLAYDMVYEALRDDNQFHEFVTDKSIVYRTPYRKNSFHDIQQNIENRIFGDAMCNRWKYESNYPWTDEFVACVRLVLVQWPEKRSEMSPLVYNTMLRNATDELERILENITKADGLTGEKGMHGYSTIGLMETARLVSLYDMFDKGIFTKMIKKYPEFLRGLKFHINTLFLMLYYPGCGDGGCLSHPVNSLMNLAGEESYVVTFRGFIWKLYKETGDVDFARFLNLTLSNFHPKGFEMDFSLEDKESDIRAKINEVISEYGSEPKQKSENYEKWKLAVLHAGTGNSRRGAFLDYDSGGLHGHNDGMNIGLYGFGMEFMPDLGYPPAHRPGGWSSAFFSWYRSAASHNTVIVDGKEHRDFAYAQMHSGMGKGYLCVSGSTVLWGIGSLVRAIGADDPEIAGVSRFERILVMIDIDDSTSYYADFFRVEGGKEHVKLMKAGLCELRLPGIETEPFIQTADPYGMGFIRDTNEENNVKYLNDGSFKFIRNMRKASSHDKQWHAEWKYTDKYKRYFGETTGRDIRLIYHELTPGADMLTYDAFLDSFYAMSDEYPEEMKKIEGHPEEMLPGIAIIKKGNEPNMTIFSAIIEPADGESAISSASAFEIKEETKIGISAAEIRLKNGDVDLIVSADVRNRKRYTIPDYDLETDADLIHLREYSDGSRRITAINVKYIRCRNYIESFDKERDIIESEIFR